MGPAANPNVRKILDTTADPDRQPRRGDVVQDAVEQVVAAEGGSRV